MSEGTEALTAPSTIEASPTAALAGVIEHPIGSEAASEAKHAELRVRDEKGRYAAQKEARETAEKRGEDTLKAEFPDLFQKKDEAEQPTAEPKKAAAEVSSEAAGDPSPRQLGRADSILQRAKISQSRIESMSPKDRVELAKELKPLVLERQQENQRSTDPGFQDKTIANSKRAGSPAGEPLDSPLPELDESIKAAEAEFGSEFAATLAKVVRAAVAPLQNELQTRRAEQSKSEAESLRTSIEAAREALVERIPELEDEETFSEDVFPSMVGLFQAQPGRFNMKDPKSVEKLVLLASRANELNEIEPRAKADKERLAQLTRNGTASSRSKAAPITGKSKDERYALAAKLAQDPSITVEDARRRVWGS